LEEWGIENELKMIEGKNHIPAFLFPGETITKSIEFLDRHLKN
jgi:hypothetical protein